MWAIIPAILLVVGIGILIAISLGWDGWLLGDWATFRRPIQVGRHVGREDDDGYRRRKTDVPPPLPSPVTPRMPELVD